MLFPKILRFLLVALGSGGVATLSAGELISFNRDIRPLLSDRCFACHGPDENERKANLRLDLAEDARRLRDGRRVIHPGKSGESELLRRVNHVDPEEVMPPPGSGRSLTREERRLLEAWIDAGADYERHWAFGEVSRPPLPNPEFSGSNPIDAFVRHRLSELGLPLSAPADREQLLRRLTFDLTGLPPSLDELNRFLDDTNPDAVEMVIDRLLSSDRYGEHMAVAWLDAARYADTNGYNNDTPRANWKWRDWVIEAFNRNLPYDQFLTEQLAGDLLPEPTLDQRVATGFNRNHSITSEGGIIDEEYRLEYVADRVHTTSLVVMGLSLQCARCHDHKFDPVTQREYYQFFAFFNQVPETGYHHEHVGNPKPVVLLASEDERDRLSSLEAELKELAQKIEAPNLSESSKEELSSTRREKEKALSAFENSLASAMVMRDLEMARDTFFLERGAYDRPGDKVLPNVPGFLSPFPEKAPRNRLGLAQWLTEREHPLTARVMVNRLWYQMFGRGLVETLEDFGSQGAWPSHPALLDWLASEFVESGWDIKAMLKLMASSKTYQQSAKLSSERLRLDPENKWFSRGPRIRLSAEMIRDNALALSGLLVHRLGGPSVRPYQPAGLWEEVAVADASYSGGAYQQDHGPDLYRRGVYTWWKRTCPPPALSTFDAPNREFCSVRRSVTNTPLQALVLLNDPTFVEAARVLAERMVQQGGTELRDRLRFGFRLVTSRRARAEEVSLLEEIFLRRKAAFETSPDEAERLLAVGETPVSVSIAQSELAALSVVASMLLNLDETIHR